MGLKLSWVYDQVTVMVSLANNVEAFNLQTEKVQELSAH